MAKFIKYEKALLEIEGKSIFAEEASLGVEASVDPIENITGSVIRYAPAAPLRGTLSFTHYLTGTLHEFLNPLTAVEWTGEPLQGSLGGIDFKSGYIKELSFSVRPFEPIAIRSSMDIYGELSVAVSGKSDAAIRGTKEIPRAIGHGATTYGAGTNLGIDNHLGFDYSVTTERNPVVPVGSGLPIRVTKENTRINMTVRGEDLGNVLTTSGYEASLDIYVHNVYGVAGATAIGRFGCTGQVFSQSMSVSANGYMAGEISLGQDYLTGKRAV